MKRFNLLYLITFILAVCSMAYELILAQALSAFLDNTVLRYSVTIGLYLCAMGFGSLMAEGRLVRRPVNTLLWVEIGLTLVGGFSLVLLFALANAGLPRWLFSMSAHGLIVLIGLLTGFELPLLIELRHKEKSESENSIIAVNYFGAFTGTLLFAFVFYPAWGIVAAVFAVGTLNACAGLLLVTQQDKIESQDKGKFYNVLSLQAVVFLIVALCLLNAGGLNQVLISGYIG